MPRSTIVPVTPAVLGWAIRESAYSADEVAAKVGVARAELSAWLEGKTQPTLTKFRKLASVLKRTPATFLLPAAPAPPPFSARFRHPPGAGRTTPNPAERRYLREAARVQEAASWIAGQLGDETSAIPAYLATDDPESAATSVRTTLNSLIATQPKDWRGAAQAFDGWRAFLEQWGILVLLFPLGKGSAQGFSLWDDRVPLIAVNTAWNEAARIFTLFHELGHLLTRTNSVCVERAGARFVRPSDPTERWCERFAAAALLPWDDVAALLRDRFHWKKGQFIEALDAPRAIANLFHLSLRAATLRLIERGAAKWELYSEIPPYADDKPKGGGGGGRDRQEIREDRYGRRTTDIFIRALDSRVLARSDVLDYLDLSDSGLSRLLSGSPQ